MKVTTGEIEYGSKLVEYAVDLTSSDIQFIDKLLQEMHGGESHLNHLTEIDEKADWIGSEEWLRQKIKDYLSQMLTTLSTVNGLFDNTATPLDLGKIV